MSARSREEEKAMFANMNNGSRSGVNSNDVENGEPNPPNDNGSTNRMLDEDENSPIGDLDAKQREIVEEHVGSEITDVTEGFTGDNLFDFENGEEWFAFESFEDAEREAIASVKNDLETEPEIFNQDFLQNHIKISETDKNIIAREDADSQVEDRDLEELKDRAKDFNISFEDPEDTIDPDDPDFDEKLEQANDVLLSKLQEEVSDAIADEIRPQLDDPIQFFVEDQGIYSREDLLKASFIQLDEDSAAKDAVETDGVAHFLASYDGEEVEVKGLFLYRRN